MLTTTERAPAFFDKLLCPACRGPVHATAKSGELELCCTAETHRFRVVNGVPILLDDEYFNWSTINPDPAVNPHDHVNWKKMQIRYHDEENADDANREYELRRPFGFNRLFETMGTYDLQLARELYPGGLKGKSVLAFCCGRGMDAEFFWREGASVAGTDIVPSCLELARERLERAGGNLATLCCDAENVPLPSDSFDVSLVHDGLHHLPQPFAAIGEMARVAREGLIIIEPNASPIVFVARKLGLCREVEASGNHKTYFDAREVQRCLRDLGFTEIRITFSFYKKTHHPPKIYDLLSHEPLHALIKTGLDVTRKVLGRWSNHLVVVARRPAE